MIRSSSISHYSIRIGTNYGHYRFFLELVLLRGLDVFALVVTLRETLPVFLLRVVVTVVELLNFCTTRSNKLPIMQTP